MDKIRTDKELLELLDDSLTKQLVTGLCSTIMALYLKNRIVEIEKERLLDIINYYIKSPYIWNKLLFDERRIRSGDSFYFWSSGTIAPRRKYLGYLKEKCNPFGMLKIKY